MIKFVQATSSALDRKSNPVKTMDTLIDRQEKSRTKNI